MCSITNLETVGNTASASLPLAFVDSLNRRAPARGERTLFLVEIDQAGIFHMSGFPAQEARAVIGVACPTTLFPYAREAISSCVIRGGFPALLLQPIDFGALFSQASRKEQAQA